MNYNLERSEYLGFARQLHFTNSYPLQCHVWVGTLLLLTIFGISMFWKD
jgi:hypothetical protein